MRTLFLRVEVNSTFILTVIATINIFLPKITVIFAQGDTKADTVEISMTVLLPQAWVPDSKG